LSFFLVEIGGGQRAESWVETVDREFARELFQGGLELPDGGESVYSSPESIWKAPRHAGIRRCLLGLREILVMFRAGAHRVSLWRETRETIREETNTPRRL
jgi:hypothetical protein